MKRLKHGNKDKYSKLKIWWSFFKKGCSFVIPMWLMCWLILWVVSLIQVNKGVVMEKDFNKILKTEYSEKFDKIRKGMMVMSYFKYGAMRENYEKFKCMDAIGNIEKRLEKYKETGNTEFLADIANFAMIEFMYPSIAGAKYTPTDSGACEIAGFSINEIRNFDQQEEYYEIYVRKNRL